MHHLLVLSDVHLWEAPDHDEMWMRYRHRRFLPDGDLAAPLLRICARVPNGSLHDPHCSIRVEESRPFLWLHSDPAGALTGGLGRFQEGEILPVSGAYRGPPIPILPDAADRSDTTEQALGASSVPPSQYCEPA